MSHLTKETAYTVADALLKERIQANIIAIPGSLYTYEKKAQPDRYSVEIHTYHDLHPQAIATIERISKKFGVSYRIFVSDGTTGKMGSLFVEFRGERE